MIRHQSAGRSRRRRRPVRMAGETTARRVAGFAGVPGAPLARPNGAKRVRTKALVVALVDPRLHADAAEGGLSLAEAVVDVGPQRVQRHPTLAVELLAAHLGTAETAGALHADALGTRLLHGLHGALHRSPEADSAGQ